MSPLDRGSPRTILRHEYQHRCWRAMPHSANQAILARPGSILAKGLKSCAGADIVQAADCTKVQQTARPCIVRAALSELKRGVELFKMRCPLPKRGALLVLIGIHVIDGGNAGLCVIQDPLGDVGLNLQA
jgi:hypothetical protein